MKQEIDIPFLKEWVVTLRSGKYPQAFGMLRETPPDGPDAFCCLGVAQDILAKKEPERYDWHLGMDNRWIFHDQVYPCQSTGTLVRSLSDRIGVDRSPVFLPEIGDRDGNVFALTDLNDAGLSFDQIADVIEYFLIPH